MSAGLLLHRAGVAGPEVLLVHMGGPFWARRDRAWSIPKGLVEAGEDPHAAALREFAEELGVAAPAGVDVPLGEVRQSGGKVAVAWARAADLDVGDGVLHGSTAVIEWPPRSGRSIEVLEVDRAAWFTVDEARPLVVAAQTELLDRLVTHVTSAGGQPDLH
ncbi:NUDIX domain-containing protein [Cellulomonas composti]|uniref:NUDIX domain-containing protein n=1 Tax=Cellulomonas composti TaxID=266130 RepID=UPI0027D94D25|nr:NUDIX domain-containing protein [Cellulomonas composti]